VNTAINYHKTAFEQ